MAIRKFKPYTPGTRQRVVTDFSEITGSKPERSLIVSKHRNKGRNNRGVITCRHRGGGHKRQYRLVDFRRDKKNIKGGMYPKLTGAIDCLEKGVKSAHIVDGRVPHSVLIELLTDKGVGTWISR